MDHQHPDYLTYLYALGITIFGAVVHATNQYKIARKQKEPWTLLDFLILLPTSVFSGGMGGFIAVLISDNVVHLFIACGIFSFLGVAGLNAISERILQVMVKKYDAGGEKK